MTKAIQRAFYVLDMAVRPTAFEQEALDKFVSARRMMQANGLTLADLCPKAKELTPTEIENKLRQTILEQEGTMLDLHDTIDQLRHLVGMKDTQITQLRDVLSEIVDREDAIDADEDEDDVIEEEVLEAEAAPQAAEIAPEVATVSQMLPAVLDDLNGLDATARDALVNGCSYEVFAALAERKIGHAFWKRDYRAMTGNAKGIFFWWKSQGHVPALAVQRLFGLDASDRVRGKRRKFAETVAPEVNTVQVIAETQAVQPEVTVIEADITITTTPVSRSRAKVRKGCNISREVVTYLYTLGDALERDLPPETLRGMICERHDRLYDIQDIVAAQDRIRCGWAAA